MKARIVTLVLILCLGLGGFFWLKASMFSSLDNLEDGDIIFQESLSSQSQAIQNATNSRYSHCGIIFKRGGEFFVYEAIQPVTYTKLDKWIKRGKDSHYVVKRLKDNAKLKECRDKMLAEAKKHMGKNYDLTFEWSDKRIYCSELIWKIYKRGAGLEVGKLEKLKDFDLSDPAVKKKIKERYGENIPLDEVVISPESIYDSRLLYTVAEN